MGYYKDEVDVVAHNLNNSTLTINKTDKATGLESIEVELKEDEVDTMESGDGMSVFVENPSKAGTIKFQILEASPTNDVMWALRETRAAFALSFLDVAAPKLDFSGKYFRIKKPPVEVRDKEAKMVEWECVTTYLKCKGGSYKAVNA